MFIEGDRPWIIYDVLIRDSRFHIREENFPNIIQILGEIYNCQFHENDTIYSKVKKLFECTGYEIEFLDQDNEQGDIFGIKVHQTKKHIPLATVLKPIAPYVKPRSFFEYKVGRPDLDFSDDLYTENHRLYFNGTNLQHQIADIKWKPFS